MAPTQHEKPGVTLPALCSRAAPDTSRLKSWKFLHFASGVLHSGLVTLHLVLVGIWWKGLERRVILSINLQTILSFTVTAVTASFGTMDSALLVFVTQKLSMRRSLKTTTPTLLSFETFNTNQSVQVGTQGILVFLPPVFDGAATPGLSEGALYDILDSDVGIIGNVDVDATGFNLTCGYLNDVVLKYDSSDPSGFVPWKMRAGKSNFSFVRDITTVPHVFLHTVSAQYKCHSANSGVLQTTHRQPLSPSFF
ncbi:hypothetical protein B0H19DRAFT_1073673 [Mycena capillaripes]|nr:hypothetical protein B0H19DRAFT_1073673 [Mycena capillaripes]